MSAISSPNNTKVAIKDRGLKKQGIVALQIIFIGFSSFLETWIRGGVGVITGVIICAVLYGGLRFGRPGTAYVSVVTPPLAFAATAFLSILLLDGFRPARVGIDFIAALASVAPFLIISALYGWFIYFNRRAKTKASSNSN